MYYLRITDYADELLAALDTTARLARARARRCRRTGSARARACASPSRTTIRGRRRRADRRRHAVRVHDARRHDHGRDVLRGGAPSIRWPTHAARIEPGARGLHRRMQARRRDRSRPRDDGKEGHADRPLRHASADRRAGRGLGRQLRADELRRRRRDGRAGARRARLRVREEVRPADPAGDRASTASDVLDRRAGRTGTRDKDARPSASTPASTTASTTRHAVDAVAADLAAHGPRREEDDLPPARLGHLAPALLGHADPDHPLRRAAATCRCRSRTCRCVLPEDCVPDGTRQSAEQARRLSCDVRLPEVRQAGAARNRHDGHLRRLVLVLHALLRRRDATTRWSTRATTTGCRWTSTSAASSTRSCTCCTRASGPR